MDRVCVVAGLALMPSLGALGSSSAPRLKLGVISDIHYGFYGNGGWTGSRESFLRALRYFRDQSVDAVLIAGDMADLSLTEELEAVAACWYETFPDDHAPDGHYVEKLFIYGNHDLSGDGVRHFHREDSPEVRESHNLKRDPAGWWKRCFREDFSGVYVKDVKGYGFVGVHWGFQSDREAIEKAVRKAAKISGPARPFFYFQHPHLKGTCHGDWVWGHDDGVSASVLSGYPNAIAFSGHSHTPLKDEKTIWQGAFTSIGTASLSYMSTAYNFRDNAEYNNFAGPVAPTAPLLTPRVNTWDSQQGLLLSVSDDLARIERRDFMSGKPLGEDWNLPLGQNADKPFVFAKRRAHRTAPQFSEDASRDVVVEERPADPNMKRPAAHVVTFPPARTVNGCRAFEYEVGATVVEEDFELRVVARRVLAKDFHLAESVAMLRGECWFEHGVLPSRAHVRFDITPIESFGIRGRTIFSEVIALK